MCIWCGARAASCIPAGPPTPAARLHAHKTGKGARATRAFHAVGMAYLERCSSKSEALRREAALKKLPKAEKEAFCAAWAENKPPPGCP